ncbi:MAG: hypothetical protein MMC33_008360 [Icmadophila ericetorum]|nr:hypothetical protein [Icmadophila ericetorum]
MAETDSAAALLGNAINRASSDFSMELVQDWLQEEQRSLSETHGTDNLPVAEDFETSATFNHGNDGNDDDELTNSILLS